MNFQHGVHGNHFSNMATRHRRRLRGGHVPTTIYNLNFVPTTFKNVQTNCDRKNPHILNRYGYCPHGLAIGRFGRFPVILYLRPPPPPPPPSTIAHYTGLNAQQVKCIHSPCLVAWTAKDISMPLPCVLGILCRASSQSWLCKKLMVLDHQNSQVGIYSTFSQSRKSNFVCS